jgi:fumarate hydratase class II
LAAAAAVFAEKCVKGISANREACAAFIERSLALVTGLVPRIGYDRAAAVAKAAYDSGRTVRDVLLEEKTLTKAEIDKLLDI